MNGGQLHQTFEKLVNRVQNDSIDSLQSFEHLFSILQCLENLKEPRILGYSDSLLSECMNNDLNSESTNESDSGQQSSEEGSTNDLKSTNKKSSLLDLILQLLSIIVNHLARQVHSKQDAELLISHWKHCLCFKQQQKGCLNKTQTDQFITNRCSTSQQADTNLLIDTNHHPCPSLFISSSGIQSDASCSPLSSLTTDCCANNLSTCSLSPSCCYSTQKQQVLNKQKSTSNNQSKQETNTVVDLSIIPPPPPPPIPPPMPQLHHNQQINPLDKSMSNGSLNNQLLISSFNSNLSANTPPQSINEVPVILLEAPKPKSKMKTLNWSKISVHKVLTSHKPNIWSKLFSKKDDKKEKKSGQKSRKSKNHKETKKNVDKFSSDDEPTGSEEDGFKGQRRGLFAIASSSKQRSSKSDANSSSSNSLTKLCSAINTSNSSINSTTTTNSSSTASKSKKQSEEDLMNIVRLDFDTLEGLFCQPNNLVGNSVGTMIANFSTINSGNNGSVPNSCPNSPSTNRRTLIQLQQQQQATANQLLFNKQVNSSVHGNQLMNAGYPLLNSFNLHQQQQLVNQANLNATNLHSSNQQSNLFKLNSYLTALNSSSQTNVGQLNNLNKLELNGRNSPSAYTMFDDRKQQTLKRCSGEFNPNVDYIHNLLDSKRSLNINIFLKQFRSVCSNDGETEIVRLVKQGDHAVFGAEKLVHLIKLLPDQAEIDLLQAYSDDLLRLPLAERFLLQLMALPKYKLRLECMLLKAEYEANFSYLNPSLDIIITAARELETCRKLHEVLYLILIAGNFLNSGGYAGDAAGFKMISVLKLSEIRANKPNISLIHYVALQAQKKQLSTFVNELSSVEKASKISLESLKCDINSLANKIFKIKQQINSTNDLDPPDWTQSQTIDQTNDQANDNDQQMNTTFFQHMREFLENSEKQIKQLTQKVETDLEQIRTQLGEFLCEELNEFKLEECFRIFSCFITKFKLALEENAKRKDEFRPINSKESQSNQAYSKFKLNSNGGKTSEQFNSLPRFKKTNKLYNSSINNNLSIMNLAEENDLDPGLVEFLSKANELNGNSGELFNGLSTFRRVGSGRRSFRQLNSLNVFASNEIDFSSRERLNTNCGKITEEESKKEENDLKNYDKDESSDEQTGANKDKATNQYESKSVRSLSTGNEIVKPNTPTAVITPTLYSSSNYALSNHNNNYSLTNFNSTNFSSNYSSNNNSSNYLTTNYSNNYTNNKILEKAQSQLSLNSIGKSKVVPIRGNPLTTLQTNSNGSLKRLNSGSCFGSNDFKSYEDDLKDYDLKDFKDYEDLKESSTNLKTCIQSLESLNNITSASSRYQVDKNSLNSLNYQERTRSLTKQQLNKSPLQSLSSYSSLKRGSSERHSFKYQVVASKVDCHNPIVTNRNLYKESSHAKDNLLDSCKYILPKTSPVLSTLNRASILRMSLNRKTAQEAKEAKLIYHSFNSSSTKTSSTPTRISTTTRPINLNPKKSSHGSHYNSAHYIEPATYLDVNIKCKSGSLATVRPLSRVNSFRTTLDKHQSRSASRSTKNVHSTSAHSSTRQPRWVS